MNARNLSGTNEPKKNKTSAWIVALVAAGAISGTAYARPEWADPAKGMTVLCGFLDPNYIRTPCTSKSKQDTRDKWRRHLGTDFKVVASATVVAPVTGKVIYFDASASKAADEAFLVIEDGKTGEEHVIGHIVSNLWKGADVVKGKPIGSVRDQGSATHVHWGFNISSGQAAVETAMKKKTPCLQNNKMVDCKWGWGKAPYEATDAEIRALGWRNVL
jgi:hypothetical protein